jgi:hypothetical protein
MKTKSTKSAKKSAGLYVRHEGGTRYGVYSRKRRDASGDHARIVGDLTSKEASDYTWKNRFE